MTKSELERIRDAEKTIRSKKLELEALRYRASGAGAIRYDKDRVQTSPNDYLAMAMDDIIKIESQIEEEEKEIEQIRADAYSVVRKMENVEHRAVLEWYYLNGLSMANTAFQMNRSERSAYDLKEEAIKAFCCT